ncbi:MAG: hypothetical protein M2R45_01969 [Verrucomicrobia subdivision 3 bacterium]|nr:hypothetical protein [Limisphaerales bacterium]MCS1416164.1 hypothetical protein [Limisphaerales bacterium]
MSSLPQPEIIFTHESDLDGFVSGCVLQRLARSLFEITVPLEPLSSRPWATLKRFPERAWVCDLSFEPKIDREGWVVFDHHITEHQPESTMLIHDTNHSAAKLCYNLLASHSEGNGPLKRLVELTNIADLYLNEHPEFNLASEYAQLVKTYHFRPLYRLVGNNLESLLDHPLLEIMRLKRKVENPIGLNWSRNHITKITPEIGYVATTIGDTNYIIHHLLESDEVPYTSLVTLFKKPNSPVTVSICSQNGEALTLAKSLQGGGHPNAAGSTLPRSVTTFDEAVTYLKQLLNPESPTEAQPPSNTEALFDSVGF